MAFSFMVISCFLSGPISLGIITDTFGEYAIKGFGIDLDQNSLYWTKHFLGFSLIYDIKNFVDPFAHSNWDLGSILTALFSGLYTYDGWDVLNMGIEEIENPRRNFPLAMLIGLVGITFIYLAINVAYFVILDGPTFSKSSAVAFMHLHGDFRYIQAVSRSGMLPSCLSCINPTCESPRCALFIYAFFAIITSFLGSAEELINYISYLGWVQRAIVMGALIWIKLKDWEVHPETIRMPIVVPIFFCLISIALVVAQFISDFGTSMIGALVFGLGIIVFILFMTENALPRFDAYRKFVILMNDKTTRWVQIVFNVMPEFCELGDRNVAIGRERDDSGASIDEAVANSANRQKFSIFVSIIKFTTTLIIIGVGFYFLTVKNETKNLSEPFANSNWNLGGILTGLFAGLYSYDSWDILNYGIEEIENPRRTMPLAIIIGLTVITILYLAMNISYFVVLDALTFKTSNAIAYDFADAAFHEYRWIVPVLVCLLLIGSIHSFAFTTSRYIQAVSRSGMLPSFMSCINTACDSPRVSLFVYCFFGMLTSFIGNPEELIKYISYLGWAQRATAMGALIWIRLRHCEVHPEAIRVPIMLPIFFLLICSALVVSQFIAEFGPSTIGLGIFILGIVFYMVFMTEKSVTRFKAYKKISRLINDKTTRWTQIIFNVMPEFCDLDDRNTAIGKKLDSIDPIITKSADNLTGFKESPKSPTCRALKACPINRNDNGSTWSRLKRSTISTNASEKSN
ncbi:hypothetical protein WR25_10310 [Diploscapter pachys]|uniref:Amino acid permease/ SLC12A domain-containing protein n=1 Tax=Diploscapter pachys TaxID=2018661 RepID=A0A2A2KYJ7_9BILA|nr:hypothetical protein WR25_10310 [Diploscapter pachys]